MADLPGAPAPPATEHAASLEQQLFVHQHPPPAAAYAHAVVNPSSSVVSPATSVSLPSSLTSPASDPPHIDILNHPVTDVLTMISALLQRIIEANDALYLSHHSHHHPHPDSRTRARSSLASAVLAFHGRNVPAISLQAYLMRILKYCPATNEVFLSLLVYFDRISKRANAPDFAALSSDLQSPDAYRPLQSLAPAAAPPPSSSSSSSSASSSSSVMPVAIRGAVASSHHTTTAASAAAAAAAASSVSSSIPATPSSFSSSYPQHAVVEPGSFGSQISQPQSPVAHPPAVFASPSPPPPPPPSLPTPPSDIFVMDSYNIHRLVISGVTVASKFFSDVFYKNSRYAKVGGLPLEELNHLELQFLILCDFRLAIPLEELQRYGDLLLQFWEREVPAQNKEAAAAAAAGHGP
ncbi:cyclin-domain-containing protein [Myxozyma melibiosi]|uniref:Cyclin-domain-containing protein n=1 Tax=Myxozyma melibiosi TaxID=54550 RepID=A0ABR1F6V4_9ASCO